MNFAKCSRKLALWNLLLLSKTAQPDAQKALVLWKWQAQKKHRKPSKCGMERKPQEELLQSILQGPWSHALLEETGKIADKAICLSRNKRQAFLPVFCYTKLPYFSSCLRILLARSGLTVP